MGSDRQHKTEKTPTKNHKATALHSNLKHNNTDLNTITISQSKVSGRMTSFWRASFENRYSFFHTAAKIDEINSCYRLHHAWFAPFIWHIRRKYDFVLIMKWNHSESSQAWICFTVFLIATGNLHLLYGLKRIITSQLILFTFSIIKSEKVFWYY